MDCDTASRPPSILLRIPPSKIRRALLCTVTFRRLSERVIVAVSVRSIARVRLRAPHTHPRRIRMCDLIRPPATVLFSADRALLLAPFQGNVNLYTKQSIHYADHIYNDYVSIISCHYAMDFAFWRRNCRNRRTYRRQYDGGVKYTNI